MLEKVSSETFEAEPCHYKNAFLLGRTYTSTTFHTTLNQIFVNECEIDELIGLLQNAKKQFR